MQRRAAGRSIDVLVVNGLVLVVVAYVLAEFLFLGRDFLRATKVIAATAALVVVVGLITRFWRGGAELTRAQSRFSAYWLCYAGLWVLAAVSAIVQMFTETEWITFLFYGAVMFSLPVAGKIYYDELHKTDGKLSVMQKTVLAVAGGGIVINLLLMYILRPVQ